MYYLKMNQWMLPMIAAVLCLFIGGISGYTVTGNKLYDPTGAKVIIRGMCRPSFEWNPEGEYASYNDYALMRNKWGANSVRISLNQDFWLAGPSYAATIDQQIKWVRELGMGVILDLHWNRGSQQNMADRNSITFWKSVATRYMSNLWVMFELYNEPKDISWDQWRNGDSEYAGMQTMYDAIRQVGAENAVIVGGLNWAFDLSGIATHAIEGRNIVYATHPYDYEGKRQGEWMAAFGFAAARYPIIMTEFGQYCREGTYVADLMAFAESYGIHWTAWAWYVQGCAFPSIISDWNGTPYPGVGDIVKRYMSGQVPTPAPGSTKAPVIAPTTAPLASGTLSVYADGISSGFEDYTWSQNYNPADTQFVRSGSKAIRTELVGYYGVYYHAKANFVLSSYNQLVFYINGGTSTKAATSMSVKLYSTTGSVIGNAIYLPVAPTANQWSQVAIATSSFGLDASTQISGVAIQSNIGGTQVSGGNVWIDDIAFVPAGPTAAPTTTPTTKPTTTPTVTPTVTPTTKPTVTPTATPTIKPTTTPTVAPTIKPTTTPTVTPTTTPTVAPTTKPTTSPSVAPTTRPTTRPTTSPAGACDASSVRLVQSVGDSWQSEGKVVTQFEVSVSHTCNGKNLVAMTITASNWNPVNSWNIEASGSSLSLPNYASITTTSPYSIGYQNVGGQASFTITSVTFK
jgi:endoglucanase